VLCCQKLRKNMLKSFQTGSKATHPEQLCVKNVHGAMIGIRRDGRRFTCVTRNGIANATPRHLEMYSVPSLYQLALSIINPKDRGKILGFLGSLMEGENNIDVVINCLELAKKSRCLFCLAGHGWGEDYSGNGPTREQRIKTAEICPHSLSDCTERKFIKYLPYILGIMGSTDITVTGIEFPNKSASPNIIFYEGSDSSLLNKREGIIPAAGKIKDVDQLMIYSQTCPCPTCARAFVDFARETDLRPTIIFNKLSRHTRNDVNQVQGYDRDDLVALRIMMNGNL